MIAQTLLQLLRIVAAYLIASFVTGQVVLVSLMNQDQSYVQEIQQGGWQFGLTISYFIAIFAAFPAFATIAVGEFKVWRMWWYYAAAGSLIGLLLGTLFQPPSFFPWLGVSFGIVSGAIYWLIAGRSAGLEDSTARLAVVSITSVVTLILAVLLLPAAAGFNF
jgi:hypothetical protein